MISIEELYMIIGSLRVEVYALNKSIGRLENELNEARKSNNPGPDGERESSSRLVDFSESNQSSEGANRLIFDTKRPTKGL